MSYQVNVVVVVVVYVVDDVIVVVVVLYLMPEVSTEELQVGSPQPDESAAA